MLKTKCSVAIGPQRVFIDDGSSAEPDATEPEYRRDVIDSIIDKYYPELEERSAMDRKEISLLEYAKTKHDTFPHLKAVFDTFSMTRLKRLGQEMNRRVGEQTPPPFDEKNTDKYKVVLDLIEWLKYNEFPPAGEDEEQDDGEDDGEDELDGDEGEQDDDDDDRAPFVSVYRDHLYQ